MRAAAEPELLASLPTQLGDAFLVVTCIVAAAPLVPGGKLGVAVLGALFLRASNRLRFHVSSSCACNNKDMKAGVSSAGSRHKRINRRWRRLLSLAGRNVVMLLLIPNINFVVPTQFLQFALSHFERGANK